MMPHDFDLVKFNMHKLILREYLCQAIQVLVLLKLKKLNAFAAKVAFA